MDGIPLLLEEEFSASCSPDRCGLMQTVRYFTALRLFLHALLISLMGLKSWCPALAMSLVQPRRAEFMLSCITANRQNGTEVCMVAPRGHAGFLVWPHSAATRAGDA